MNCNTNNWGKFHAFQIYIMKIRQTMYDYTRASTS